jgi:hypothetical protein
LLDAPLQYAGANKRLLIFGQQTNSWYKDFRQEATSAGQDAVVYLMNGYLDFGVGEYYLPHAFWGTVHQLFRILNQPCLMEREREGRAVLWNNVIKIDKNGGKPPESVVEFLADVFPVTAQEILITKPDAVLFLSGHPYDRYLSRVLPSAALETVGSFPLHQLARLVGAGLPRASFRTYHPNFFVRGQRDLYERVLDTVCDELLGSASAA